MRMCGVRACGLVWCVCMHACGVCVCARECVCMRDCMCACVRACVCVCAGDRLF